MKSAKRFLSALLCLCMVLSVIPVMEAEAAVFEDFTYTLINGKVTITDFNAAYEGEVVIPDTISGKSVTAIGKGAFADCYGITAVTIPDTVTTIGENAFLACKSLKKVTLPANLTTIGKKSLL